MNDDKKLQEEESQVIGKRITQLRLRLGISQKDLAKACYFSPNTITSLEKGSIIFHQYHRLRICRFFGVGYEVFDPSQAFTPPEFPEMKESAEAYLQENNPKELQAYKDKLSSNKVLLMLRERVLPSGFLNVPREVKTIRKLLKEDYSIQPSSSTISNALKKLIEEKKIVQVASSKKRVFLYVMASPAAQK
ncbi:MAG: helix-turn-helix transcriptional regulator [Chitinophagaceae bacterium]